MKLKYRELHQTTNVNDMPISNGHILFALKAWRSVISMHQGDPHLAGINSSS